MAENGAIIEVPIINQSNIRAGAVRWRANVDLIPTMGGALPKQFETIIYGGVEHPDIHIRSNHDPLDWRITGLSYKSPTADVSIETRYAQYSWEELMNWVQLSRIIADDHIKINRDGARTMFMHQLLKGRKRIDLPTPSVGKRPRMTDKKLLKVAEIYMQAPRGGVEAVMEAYYPISKATAARWVKQAREENLIEDRRRNKSN